MKHNHYIKHVYLFHFSTKHETTIMKLIYETQSDKDETFLLAKKPF